MSTVKNSIGTLLTALLSLPTVVGRAILSAVNPLNWIKRAFERKVKIEKEE